MITVDSSAIKAVEYKKKAKTLEIFMNNDKSYKYIGVPVDVYIGFLEADSKGTFYNESIKGIFKTEEQENTYSLPYVYTGSICEQRRNAVISIKPEDRISIDSFSGEIINYNGSRDRFCIIKALVEKIQSLEKEVVKLKGRI
jgi:hypothetical protein